MPIISLEIMKIIDERETQKNPTKTKKTKAEKNKGGGSYSESMRTKWFYCAFSPIDM